MRIGETEVLLFCDLEANYSATENTIQVRVNKKRQSLAEFFTNYPLQFRTSDDSLITGSEIFRGDPNAIVFDSKHIKGLRWDCVDIGSETKSKEIGKKSIHQAIENELLEDKENSYIIYDHGSGEIADFLTIKSDGMFLNVTLFHIKSKKGKHYNSSVDDVYEVTQQAVKSTIWLKDKKALSDKINLRLQNNPNKLRRGEHESLNKLFNSDYLLQTSIIIVQPAINKNSVLPDKIGEVLAAGRSYITHSGRAKEMMIWGSDE